MAVSGIFGLRNLQKLELSIRFPDEIYCDIPAQLTLQLCSRRSSLPHYLLTLRLHGAETDFTLLSPSTRSEAKIPVTFHQRGRVIITRAAVTSPFPVNFFVRSNLLDLNETCLVFPKPLPLPGELSREVRNESGITTQRMKGSSGEAESIGLYTETEPLKQIHWKLTARHDELLVKELAVESGRPVIIELDMLPGGIEARLCHAAHIINSQMAAGRAVGLKTGANTISPGVSRSHRLTMLAELATYAAD